MSKFKCKCLNVTVHVKEKATRYADGKAFVSELEKSAFFSLDLYEVELAVGGITKEVGSLVKETKIEDWNVFTCINCKMDTHALHVVKKYDRVLISQEMESDPDVLNKNASSPEYSSIFKILLKPVKENEEVILDNSCGHAILLGQDAISLAMVSVQEQVKKYLEGEETSMNERIRKFAEEQKAQFASLQSRAFKDKQALYWSIKREEERSLETSLNEAIGDSSSDTALFSKPEHPVALKYNKYQHPVNQVHITQVGSQKYPVHPATNQPSYKMRKTTRKGKQQQKDLSCERDADPVFSLDDFADDCEPFFESEEDDLSSDNSFQAEEHLYNNSRLKNVKKSMQYSTSVPITMPSGKNSPSEDDEFVIPEPSKIGESMKAIARSVHESSEGMFGELPRPRRSTLSYR